VVQRTRLGTRRFAVAGVLAAMAVLLGLAVSCSAPPTPTPAPPPKPAQGLSGSLVVEGTRGPISKAEVSLWKGPAYTASVASALTDESGGYSLPMPEPGEYRLVPSHPQYAFSPAFATIKVEAGVPALVTSFTAQQGSVLRLVVKALGTQQPPPASLGALVYKESPSFESPNADGMQMAVKEADGSYYLAPLLKDNKQYYQVCPVSRGYIFEPECAAIETGTRPGIVTLSFNYRPR
jgi:hypothetical protein